MSEDKKTRKKASAKIWNLYQVKETSVIRMRKDCPRCGKGVFLAEHENRATCGRCGYTLFKKKE